MYNIKIAVEETIPAPEKEAESTSESKIDDQDISAIEAEIEAEINGEIPINNSLINQTSNDETAENIASTTTDTMEQTILKDQTTLVSDISHAIALEPVESSRVEC